MATLLPLEADYGEVDATAFLRVLRSSHKVRQGRLNKILRHDEPNGFRIWIGGPPFAVRPESLTMMMVLAHDATVAARLVARDTPDPPSAAWLRALVETDDMPIAVEVPHTRTATTIPLPADISIALSGSIAGPARWYDDPDHFARLQQRSADGKERSADGKERSADGKERSADGTELGPRSTQSLVDPRLFGAESDGAIVSGIVESAASATSGLWGELTTIRLRTAFDIPIVVWCAPTDDPPPPGAVFDGTVALCASSPDLE